MLPLGSDWELESLDGQILIDSVVVAQLMLVVMNAAPSGYTRQDGGRIGSSAA